MVEDAIAIRVGPVPEGWEIRRCNNVSGSPFYYYNRTTNSSQWERPVQELFRQTNSESQDGGAAAPQRGTRRERAAITSAMSRTARRGKRSRPPVQTTWAWQARQGDGSTLQTELAEAQERIRGLEKDLANADWVHEDYVHTEAQRLADAQEQVQELKEDRLEYLNKYKREMDEVRREACKARLECEEVREELEKKASEILKHQKKREDYKMN